MAESAEEEFRRKGRRTQSSLSNPGSHPIGGPRGIPQGSWEDFAGGGHPA